MSTRRSFATMEYPRRSHTGSSQPRHVPRTRPDETATYTTQSHIGDDYTYTSGPQDSYMTAPCWPQMTDYHFYDNGSSYIPTSSAAPKDIMSQAWQIPTTGADMYTPTITPTSGMNGVSPDEPFLPLDCFSGHYAVDNGPDFWVPESHCPPSPPSSVHEEELFPGCNDEPATACEYTGKSSLQFSSAPVRSRGPRPLRSASERSSDYSTSGSPKDESRDRTKHNPRSDPRYDAKPDHNGNYHCPFAGEEGCNHQPIKQKCIYAKNLDSHLKPYMCTRGNDQDDCRNMRFSSNACLFRHEREMHGAHGHGTNPYRCEYEGCDRATAENGFPRRWNLFDHMKRVHGWEGKNNDVQSDDVPRRRRGPSTSHSVPMKRTVSKSVPYTTGPRTGVPRYATHAPPIQRKIQAVNTYLPTEYYQLATHSYGVNPIMVQSY